MKKLLSNTLIIVILFTSLAWTVNIISWESNYNTGADVWIELEGKPNNIQDWVGIYPKNASNDWNNVIDWRWAKDTTPTQVDKGDWYKFILEDGEYEARFFLNNSYKVDDKVLFSVGIKIVSLGSSKLSYKAQEEIVINFSGLPGNNGDWIGIYPKDTSNDWENVVTWLYTNGTESISHDGLKKGSIHLEGIDVGKYEARLFFNNSFKVEKRVSFGVTDDNVNEESVVIGARAVKSTPKNLGKLFASPNGNGDCTSPENACNIGTAIYKLNTTNNILFLLGGIYNLDKKIYIQKSGTESKPLIIESFDTNKKAVLIGNFNSDAIIKLYQSKHIQLRNLEIKDFNGFGIRIRASSNVKVVGCITHDNKKSGISLYYTNNSTIVDNISYNNIDEFKGNADGIQIQVSVSSDNKIVHNTVYNNSDDGIDTIAGINTLISYNISYRNLGREGKNGGKGNGIGIKACGEYAKGSKVLHNIAFENNGNGFECNENNGEGVVFKYNTAYNNGGYGFENNKEYSQAKLSRNISSNNASHAINGIQNNNSWKILNKNVQFISTRPNSKDFLKPTVGSVFENIGAYAKLPVVNNNKQAKIFVIGDSTTFNKDILDGHGGYYEMGWAQKEALGSYMLDKSNLFDEGRSGASSKTYKTIIDNKHDWQETKNLIKNTDISDGAYLLIQFGHNDEKGKGYTIPNEFYSQLEEYVDWAKSNDIIPILITPVERRAKSKGNLNHKTHEEAGGYAQKVRDLAEAKSITMLDLQSKSWNEYNTYEDMDAINTVLAYDDNTHFSPKGAQLVAGWVKELICESSEEKLCLQFK